MVAIATMVAMSNRGRAQLFFTATIYTLCLWLFLQYIVQAFSINAITGLLLIQITSSIVFAIAILFYGFIRSYINKPMSNWSFIWLFIIFVIEFMLNISGSMIQQAHGENSGIIISQSTFLYLIYTIIIGLIFIVGIYQLLRKTLVSKLKKDRSRNIVLMFGFLQAVILIVVSNIFLQSFAEGQTITSISLFAMSLIVGLAIIRYQFFDVRLAIVRSVTYSLVLATLAGLYFVFAFIFSNIFDKQLTSPGQVASGVVISLILAVAFQPLRRFFDKLTNKLFYKDNYNTDDFFARLNKTLSVTTDLRGLLERVAYEISHTLKAEQAFFFIYTNADGNYISAGTEKHNHLPKHDAILVEQKSQGKDNIISESSLDEGDPIRRMMISHRIGLILPLMQDSAVVGYLCLGEHLTSGYTNRDIKALNTLSDELIIAIQNALAVHEIREINATLQQRISNATKELRSKNAILLQLDKIKDEFVSMASHQLRTPLTSVKGYLSMVIEGDAGKITPSQKQLLDQAFMSSENMVHLINDFLNVSRIQSGKFIIDKIPVDLSRLVEEEVNGLRPNATARGMKLIYKKPAKFPLVEVDEGKMRQVVMNFADNAIYYSHENSSIIISLGVEGNEIVFTVKDTGIGVPKSEKDRLFAKFYRAANAKIQRPDGTGVGIYLAKKVIDAHGGQIIFESVEGKGSTFGFRLPLKPIEPTPPATTLN